MILTKEVKIGVGPLNVKYFESRGYEIPRRKDSKGRVCFKKGSKIIVKVSDLFCTSKVKVSCQCEDCGEVREVQFHSLCKRTNSQFKKDGKTLCSDCANHRMSGEKSGRFKHGQVRYPEYRNNAQRRNLDFQLTPEEFKELVGQPCHYCGGYSIETNPKSRGNGIDRKDSNIGYLVDNCVPCCATCNFFKNTMEYTQFIKKIRDLYRNTKHYSNI